ncbi:MAG: DUF2069 domain-containing protein [Aquabacterium sp.]|jgi:uncharacterized membrane protein|nr:MAG: DUF2069 domain-containing protein [Aquabacterium sp.]
MSDAPPPSLDAAQLAARITLTRRLAVGSTLGLIVLGVAWELWLAPLPGGTGKLAWKVLPLTFAVAGLLKEKLYTYRWVSLLVWLYVTEGLVRATSDGGAVIPLALLELVLGLTLFTACALHVRLRLANGRLQASAAG